MEDEKDDIRSDLEAAFEQHAEPETGRSPEDTEVALRPTSEEIPLEPTTAEAPLEGDEKPIETKAGREKDPVTGKFKPAVDKLPAEDKKGPETESPVSGINPPAGWKAVARQEWAKIPKAAQEEIVRRESETSKALSTSVNARKHFDEFNQTVAPFMPLIRAQNSSPMGAFKNLMTTAAGLTVGNPEQKARIIAEMIGNFGIDIQTLDNVLSQAPQRQQAGGTNPVEVAIQRQLAPVYDFMKSIQQGQQTREQQMAQEADQSVNSFAKKNEFFDDVRDDVADLLELNAKRGREMTLDQAYKIAVANRDDIQGIIQQRNTQQRARQNTSNVQRARQAASSISGSPNLGVKNASEPQNRRDDLAAAWDELSGN